ncbi:MAG: FkbM family methyltransferase [Taibaiella sp.]|nr:FkbM family methyltransferase [Taibaiella sp.]
MLRIKLITALIHLNESLIFYPRLKRFYKNNIKKTNPVIIDVGSNKGQTIDFFLSHFKDSVIYGFEPNRDLYLGLCEKYKHNKNITITNCGVSDKEGKLLFNETIMSETSTFETLNLDSDYLKMKSKVLGVSPDGIIKKSYEVDVVTLYSFIQKIKIEHIDVIKIDTEGHEYKCMLGLFEKPGIKVGFIQLEQHNNDMHANKVTSDTINDLLNANNYKLFTRIKHGFGDFVEAVYAYNS